MPSQKASASGHRPTRWNSSGEPQAGRPSRRTSPWLGASCPAASFRNVDLPAPLGPSRPVTPGPTVVVTSLSAMTGPYQREARTYSSGRASPHDLHRAHAACAGWPGSRGTTSDQHDRGLRPGERRSARSRMPEQRVARRTAGPAARAAPTPAGRTAARRMPRTSSRPISRPKNPRPATRALRESEETASATRLMAREMTSDVQHDRGPDPGQLPLQELVGGQGQRDDVEQQAGHQRSRRGSAPSARRACPARSRAGSAAARGRRGSRPCAGRWRSRPAPAEDREEQREHDLLAEELAEEPAVHGQHAARLGEPRDDVDLDHADEEGHPGRRSAGRGTRGGPGSGAAPRA